MPERFSLHPTDRECVLAQLREAVEVSVRRLREAHPYGSTVAVETRYEVDLRRPAVELDLETEMIPVDVVTECVRGDFAFRVRFTNPRVQKHRLTYDAELV